MMNGKTGPEVVAMYPLQGASGPLGYGPIHDADKGNSAFLNSKTITLSDLYNSTALDAQVILDSFSFISRPDSAVTNNLRMVVYQGDTLLGTSNVVTYDTNATTNNNRYGTGTFAFSTEITLDASTAYTYKLVNEDGTAYTGDVGMGLVNTSYWSGKNGGYQMDGTTNYQAPIISIATHSVPEPATAALGLLGLSALMEGRRRRA